jgi:hypothetical protein
MGMAQHMKISLFPMPGLRGRGAGPQVLQGRLGLIQKAKGILWVQGLQNHGAGDQGSVVMEGTAQAQLEL